MKSVNPFHPFNDVLDEGAPSTPYSRPMSEQEGDRPCVGHAKAIAQSLAKLPEFVADMKVRDLAKLTAMNPDVVGPSSRLEQLTFALMMIASGLEQYPDLEAQMTKMNVDAPEAAAGQEQPLGNLREQDERRLSND